MRHSTCTLEQLNLHTVATAFSKDGARSSVSFSLQVHYGPASLSALSRLPSYFVFRQASLDVTACAQQITRHAADTPQRGSHAAVLVLLDQPYAHATADLRLRIDAAIQSAAGAAPAPAGDSAAEIAAAGAASALPVIVADTWAGPLEPTGASAAWQRRASAQAATAAQDGSYGCRPPAVAAPAAAASGTARLAPAAADAPGPPSAGTQAAGISAAQTAAAQPDACSAPRPASPPQDGSGAAAAGLSWSLTDGVAFEDVLPVWVGAADSPGLRQLQLVHSRAAWSVLDPGRLASSAAESGGSRLKHGGKHGGSNGGTEEVHRACTRCVVACLDILCIQGGIAWLKGRQSAAVMPLPRPAPRRRRRLAARGATRAAAHAAAAVLPGGKGAGRKHRRHPGGHARRRGLPGSHRTPALAHTEVGAHEGGISCDAERVMSDKSGVCQLWRLPDGQARINSCR